MAEVSFSIAQLFEQQFGYKSEAFNFDKVPGKKEKADGGSPLYSLDSFGREYFMPVWLGETLDSLIEIPYPVIRIECRKTIVETPLTERNGTVKELIYTQDYRITIKGLAVNSTPDWPEQSIKMLNNLFKINNPIYVQSALTDIFLIPMDRNGDVQAVISSISFPENKGAKNVCPYEIELVSDNIFSLNEI